MVVEPKIVQLIESDEKSVDLFSSIGRMVKKPYLFCRIVVQLVEVESQLI